MRVKVLFRFVTDYEKQNEMRIKIEKIAAKKKLKSKKLWSTLERYSLWVYENDPLFIEILNLRAELDAEKEKELNIMKDEESDKIQQELYEIYSKKLKAMEADGKSDDEIVKEIRPYRSKIEEFAAIKEERLEEKRKICEEFLSGCDIQIVEYRPEYTEEELGYAIGYIFDGNIVCEVSDGEDEFLEWCPECKEISKQIGPYVLKSNRKIRQAAQEKKVFISDDGLAVFVTVPMYEYLLNNEIAPKYFRPAYFDHKKKKLAGYQFIGSNHLPVGSFIDSSVENGEKCTRCGKIQQRHLDEDPNDIKNQYYHNIYIDCDRVEKWEDINVARHEQAFWNQRLIFSSKLLDLLKQADNHITWIPVFPLSIKEMLEGNKMLK